MNRLYLLTAPITEKLCY